MSTGAWSEKNTIRPWKTRFFSLRQKFGRVGFDMPRTFMYGCGVGRKTIPATNRTQRFSSAAVPPPKDPHLDSRYSGPWFPHPRALFFFTPGGPSMAPAGLRGCGASQGCPEPRAVAPPGDRGVRRLATDHHPHSEPAVGMLDSGRVESTGLVGFAQTPIVLNDSLRLRVPTDRLRRKSYAPTSW